MVTVNDSIIEKNTGWRTPRMASQYSVYGEVNDRECYAFSNLGKILTADTDCTKPNSGGVGRNTKSPLVFCYDYGFNIPNGAVITKVLVRVTRRVNTVKTDSVVKDNLVQLKIGTNVSKAYDLPNLAGNTRWTNNQIHRKVFGEHKTKSVEDLWGVNVTPALANNQQFGLVYQCTGLTDEFMVEELDCIEMCVYYTQMGTMSTSVENTVEAVKQKVDLSSVITCDAEPYYFPDGASEPTRYLPASKSIENVYDYMPFWIRYTNPVQRIDGVRQVKGGFYPEVKVHLSSALRFDDGSQDLTLKAFGCWGSLEEEDIKRGYKSYLVPVKVYPNEVGDGVITITGLKYDDGNGGILTRKVFHIEITEYYFEAVNSMLTLDSCTFVDCNATEGQCVYNKGRMNYRNIVITDKTGRSKLWYDYDKYRDKEF